MAHVVFLRAANVGGRNVFRPARIAAALAHLGIVNVGAAGTFVVRQKTTAASIRREILTQLTFEPGLVIFPARDVLELVESEPFRGVSLSKDLRGWVAALDGRPRALRALPRATPEGRGWSVRIDRVDGNFALGLWRRRPSGFVYPNSFVEDELGVPATTRYWDTLQRIAGILNA